MIMILSSTQRISPARRVLLVGSATALLTSGVAAAPAFAEPPSPNRTTTRVQVPQSAFIDCGDFLSTARFDVLRTDQWTNDPSGSLATHRVELAYHGTISGPATSIDHVGTTTLTYNTSRGTVTVVGLGRHDEVPAASLTVHDSAVEVLSFAARDILRATSPQRLREADYDDMCRRLRSA
jgi:hypothetical protein